MSIYAVVIELAAPDPILGCESSTYSIPHKIRNRVVDYLFPQDIVLHRYLSNGDYFCGSRMQQTSPLGGLLETPFRYPVFFYSTMNEQDTIDKIKGPWVDL